MVAPAPSHQTPKAHKSVKSAFTPGTTVDIDKWVCFTAPQNIYDQTKGKILVVVTKKMIKYHQTA